MEWAARFFRPKIQDDRKVPVALLRESILQDPRVADARFRLIVEKCNSETNFSLRTVVGFFASAIIAVVLMTSLTSLGVPNWAGYSVVALVASGCLMLFARRMARHRAPKITALLLHEGLCPTCLYSFVGLEVQSDGCFVCPECQSAWRSERVAHRTSFEVPASESVVKARVFRWTQMSAGTLFQRNLPDDAGKPGVIVSTIFSNAQLAAADPSRIERLIAARAALRSSGWGIRLVLACYFALLSFMAIVDATSNFFVALSGLALGGLTWTGTKHVFLFFVSSFGVFALAWTGWFIWRSSFAISARKMRSVCLTQRLCPRCAADLRGVADPQGLVECHECQARWKARDLTAPGPAAP